MRSNVQTSAAAAGRPLLRARHESGVIQRDLALAGAELELTNAILDRGRPPRVKRSVKISQALAQNDVIENKVRELDAVNRLLNEEVTPLPGRWWCSATVRRPASAATASSIGADAAFSKGADMRAFIDDWAAAAPEPPPA
jgi:hypothetical protein